MRNAYDMNCLAVPAKYRELGDFHEYYSGARKAPYLTIFVGGNHEASNYLLELYHGGWVAPNIYYLGAANVVRLGPLRIAALSGIWKGYNYRKLHHERLPFNEDDIRSVYHVRELDTRKLLQLRTQIDVGISHDWPQSIEWSGNWKQLFNRKKDFEADSRNGRLGSVAAKLVLHRLRPAFWFSAHLHIKFSAIVSFDTESDNQGGPMVEGGVIDRPAKNPDEIDLDLSDEDVGEPNQEAKMEYESVNGERAVSDSGDKNSIRDNLDSSGVDLLTASKSRQDAEITQDSTEAATGIWNRTTRFLALDKCLPKRDFLQLLGIASLSGEEAKRPLSLEYDKEWLAIVRVFADDLVLGNPSAFVEPDKGEAFYRPLIIKEEAWVEENLVQTGRMGIPDNFERTAPQFDPIQGTKVKGQPREYSNPQTTAFCDLLQIPNPFHTTEEEITARARAGPRPSMPQAERGGGRERGSFRGGFGRGNGRRMRGRGGARGQRRG